MVATTAPFRARLEEAVRGQHSQMHPFTDAWVSGQLTRPQLGEWARQHYHYVGKFSQWCGTVYGRCPDQEARDFLLENMWEEEMGNRHSELLIRFAEACGFSRDDVLNVDVLPTTRGLTAWCYEMANAHSFLEAAAGLLVGLESQTPGIYRRNTPPLLEKYGFTEREVEFFIVHQTADEDHGERGYQIVERHATTPALQDLAVRTVREATAMRWQYMGGLHRRFVLGEERL
jgi:pyrroloquinoline-quinone synthase